MRRLILAACLSALVLTALPGHAFAVTPQGQQELVDRATLAAQDVLNDPGQGNLAAGALRRARAVMICPRVFRAGFVFGGEGGGCVLLARGGQGSWSSPAFYAVGGGSFGLQVGIQDAEVVMMIMTPSGLRAVMDSQFRLGASASVALITVGGGVEGATSVNLDADIVAFARTRGLFAGISLQGTVMSSDSAGDEAYYNQTVGAEDVVLAMRVSNPGADPLRSVLMHLGAPAYAAAPVPAPYAAAAPPAYGSPGGYGAAPAPGAQYAGAPTPLMPVQQQALPPPR